MPPFRALLLEHIHPDATALLTSAGFQVETLDRALDEDELVERVGDVTLLGIRSKTHVTARVLDASPELQAFLENPQVESVAKSEVLAQLTDGADELVTVGQLRREYLVHVPQGYRARAPVPRADSHRAGR